ncbi:MAG: hypothetical protein HDR88_09810 [Bacteroides sp.]|nr:hypothetical protein [Bacteroides sp.]MBD5357282.1 hypothetical protein [Bacteroides sp.]
MSTCLSFMRVEGCCQSPHIIHNRPSTFASDHKDEPIQVLSRGLGKQ